MLARGYAICMRHLLAKLSIGFTGTSTDTPQEGDYQPILITDPIICLPVHHHFAMGNKSVPLQYLLEASQDVQTEERLLGP